MEQGEREKMYERERSTRRDKQTYRLVNVDKMTKLFPFSNGFCRPFSLDILHRLYL